MIVIQMCASAAMIKFHGHSLEIPISRTWAILEPATARANGYYSITCIFEMKSDLDGLPRAGLGHLEQNASASVKMLSVVKEWRALRTSKEVDKARRTAQANRILSLGKLYCSGSRCMQCHSWRSTTSTIQLLRVAIDRPDRY